MTVITLLVCRRAGGSALSPRLYLVNITEPLCEGGVQSQPLQTLHPSISFYIHHITSQAG